MDERKFPLAHKNFAAKIIPALVTVTVATGYNAEKIVIAIAINNSVRMDKILLCTFY